MRALTGIERACGAQLEERALRAAVLAELRRDMAFDAYAWLLTDPETCVGHAPLAEVPVPADLPRLVRLKYLTATNRWTSLAADAATTLQVATGGDPGRSPMWRELLSGYGIDDVASVAFRDRYGCWGFLDLWRSGGDFTPTEIRLLSDMARMVTPALRGSLAASFASAPPPAVPRPGPVVILLGDDLRPSSQTPATDALLRALLPTPAERSPVPAAAFNVAAQLLAREQGVDDHQAWARTHEATGSWVTVSAARLEHPDPGGAVIAVSVDPTPTVDRVSLYALSIGLSERERELLAHLVTGSDTRELAARMLLSEHTVQDHLKSIFARAGVRTRRLLVARSTGMR